MYAYLYIANLAKHSRSMCPRAEHVHYNTEKDPSPENAQKLAGLMKLEWNSLTSPDRGAGLGKSLPLNFCGEIMAGKVHGCALDLWNTSEHPGWGSYQINSPCVIIALLHTR